MHFFRETRRAYMQINRKLQLYGRQWFCLFVADDSKFVSKIFQFWNYITFRADYQNKSILQIEKWTDCDGLYQWRTSVRSNSVNNDARWIEVPQPELHGLLTKLPRFFRLAMHFRHLLSCYELYSKTVDFRVILRKIISLARSTCLANRLSMF